MSKRLISRVSFAIALCLMLQVIFAIPVYSFANANIEDGNNNIIHSSTKLDLYIMSDYIPCNAIDYAREYFQSISTIQFVEYALDSFGSLSLLESFQRSSDDISSRKRNDLEENSQVYTEWRTDDRDGHCMVIRGYYFDTEHIGPATLSISLMDPNRTTYQLFAGADESMILGYNIGSDTYYYEYANY